MIDEFSQSLTEHKISINEITSNNQKSINEKFLDINSILEDVILI